MQSDVFYAEKKPIWQSTLGALGLAVLMVAGTFLGLDPVISFTLIIFFFVLLVGGVLLLPYAYHPMEFRVDDGGMEVRARGQATRILWTQLEEVRIVQAPGRAKGDWLMAWPKQAPMQLPYRMYHPEWRSEHAAVKVCELGAFKEDAETIKAAVRGSAGPLWNDSTSMR
ncbi:hypothetical protein [Actinomadura formosensis]|uniref:hypothetical protein n=1 Tax=Actinomadura formosensis TaxID=60706 RepID=UPI00083595ED|nr:hypothetical protein [Actinomadura formosensis]